MFGFFNRTVQVDADSALPGRTEPVLELPFRHRIFGDPLDAERPGTEVGYFGLGCFWGAERLFWELSGVVSTGVGYMGGYTANPTYQEVCSGMTGHAEVVRVVFDPAQVSYRQLLKVFLENHDPTQGDRQGNDVGTQYRSAIYTTSDAQYEAAEEMLADFQHSLAEANYGSITTDLAPAGQWYWAEDYHQQYLDANPNGYCPIHSTGIKCG